MMCKRLFSFFFAIALFTTVTWAVPIPVENFSFELPGTGKRMGFDEIPGWNTDGSSSGSGVEPAGDPTDGDYTAFLMGSDPFIWQLTNHTILRGDIIELRVDAGDAGVFLSLYYDDNGTRITVASSEVEVDGMQEYSLVFNSADAPDSVNHLLGIELGNVTGEPGDWVHVDNVRLDLVQAGKSDFAYQPSPANGQTDVFFNAILNWTPGQFAKKHNVYFSANFDDVHDGVALVSPGQDANSYNPGRLEFDQTYFWRVDEVNGVPDFTIYTGPVWSFVVEPFARLIDTKAISATASSQVANQGPERTIDLSGLDANDLHSNNGLDMWLSDVSEPNSAWIQYEFDKPHKMHQMLVWNFNGPGLNALAGCKDVIVQYSLDGTNWTQVDGVSEFTLATGTAGYAHNTTVHFDGMPARYVRLSANSNWSGGFINQYGLSEVQFLHIPVAARLPNPASGATNVAIDITLSWGAGREAAEHNVYISKDEQAVIDGTAPAVTVSEASYGPLSLDLGSVYYWRVDEVNNVNTVPIWQGDVWSFTTQEYLVVDDFEQYDDFCDRIFYAWVDGFGHSGDPDCGVEPSDGNGTGSTVGNLNAPFAERTIVHEGRQSMPLGYDNSAAPYYPEAQREWAVPQNWTRGGASALTLWFYGDPGNPDTDRMYIKVNDAKVIYDGSLAQEQWQEFSVDLASLGIDLSNVTSITIGFERIGASGGSGMVFIDDIRLRP